MGEMNHIHNLPHSLEAYIGEQSLRTKAAFLWRDYHIVILSENKFIFTRERETKYEILNDVWSVAGLLREVTERRIVDLKNLDDISALIWQLLLAWRYFKERVSGIYPFAHNEHSDALMRFIADPLASMQVYTLFGINYRRFAQLDRCTLGIIMTDYLARVHHDIDFVKCIFSDSTYLATEYVSDDVKRIAASLYSRYGTISSRDIFFELFDKNAIYPLLDALLVTRYSFSYEEFHLVSVISNELHTKKYDPKKVLVEMDTDTYMITCSMCQEATSLDLFRTYKGTCGKCYKGMPDDEKPENVREQIPLSIKREVCARDFKDQLLIRCPICNTQITHRDKVYGHVTAVANGGKNTADNIKCICSDCNSAMGTTNMYEFRQRYLEGKVAQPRTIENIGDVVINVDDEVKLFSDIDTIKAETDTCIDSIEITTRTTPPTPRKKRKQDKKQEEPPKSEAPSVGKHIDTFLNDMFTLDKNAWIYSTEVYKVYKQYCFTKKTLPVGSTTLRNYLKKVSERTKMFGYVKKSPAYFTKLKRKST